MKTETYHYTHCNFGVATRDVTPPVGIYTRSWGAAKHDTAEGVHRPCIATAALMAPLDAAQPLLALVAVDIGWFQNLEDEKAIRATVMQRTGLKPEGLLINMSHTHASVNANSFLVDRPGGELIKPYLLSLGEQISEAVLAARATMAPAWITYGYGRSALATNRDYRDTERQLYACGYNPGGPADDTLLVARVTGEDGGTRATFFNYACHPTTLAWDNHLLSPDFVGAAREVLQHAFGAPALFLQGASGELAPRHDYVGDTAVADRNGRQLGYAAAAAIEALPPAATKFVYTGIMPSGTNLGTWAYQPLTSEELADSGRLETHMLVVDLPRKELPAAEDFLPQYQAATDRRQQELLLRRLLLQQALGHDPVHHMSLWIWRLGDAALVAIPNEPYSLFQRALRQHFAATPLLILGTTNGTLGYLPPQESYGQGIYQEQQSPYQPGCLEKSIAAATQGLTELLSAR